jgi:hypothetical protein
MERQLTADPCNKLLTHTAVWSPDGLWVVYDTRSDEAGSAFDGCTIEVVNVVTGEQRVLYGQRGQPLSGAHVGVVTWHPREAVVAFIQGPPHPTSNWRYGPAHRQGVTVFMAQPGIAHPIDARDLSASTPGALRGGSHVHVWHPGLGGPFPAGGPPLPLMSFTYDDALVPGGRQVGLALTDRNVLVPPHSLVDGRPRNHPGHAFSVLATRGVAQPRPGSDDFARAFEEGWCNFGRSLAFVGEVRAADGRPVHEVFALDLPDDLADLTRAAPGQPLQGSPSDWPWPPTCLLDTTRRLTRFADQPRHSGVSVLGVPTALGGRAVRHWLRGSPRTGEVAFLAPDGNGVLQLWLVPPGGSSAPRMLSRLPQGVSSAFNFLPGGSAIAHAAGGRLALTDAISGATRWLHDAGHPARAAGTVLPHCICPSPDGRHLAYLRRLHNSPVGSFNQIFLLEI